MIVRPQKGIIGNAYACGGTAARERGSRWFCHPPGRRVRGTTTPRTRVPATTLSRRNLFREWHTFMGLPCKVYPLAMRVPFNSRTIALR
jgi:hypothetical protein